MPVDVVQLVGQLDRFLLEILSSGRLGQADFLAFSVLEFVLNYVVVPAHFGRWRKAQRPFDRVETRQIVLIDSSH